MYIEPDDAWLKFVQLQQRAANINLQRAIYDLNLWHSR